jgi:uncharacterized membrane protein YedE/YeeE
MSFGAKQKVVALGAGILFSVGLVVSGMTVPANIIGFLDVAGEFRPALMFVMVGAIAVNALVVALLRKRSQPLCADRFLSPTKTTLDARLLGGAALFGVGWGLGGFCPGPGIVALASGALPALVFVGSMLAAMAVTIRYEHAAAARAQRAADLGTQEQRAT